jgi:hypothetical protein
MGEFKIMSVSDLLAECEAEDALQATLSPRDTRHRKMFQISPCKEWLSIYWGGYEYPYELKRLERPEDLMWLVVHLSEKEWHGMTASRIGHLIKSVSQIKGWPMYGRARHPNEAPKPNHSKIAEREKMTAQMRYSVIKRDAYRCRCCGFAVQDGAHLHVDHIVAVANGGRTEMGNLQTLCTVCNLGKGAA